MKFINKMKIDLKNQIDHYYTTSKIDTFILKLKPKDYVVKVCVFFRLYMYNGRQNIYI